ncbi:MAG: glutamine--fructose-6-phosphate transaminase (isomerizing), partial [Clostridia bacterium]|nr:glutamine--fructose-6-phosphate transaminase (isomerizing) [Clostridia bacterium]
MCGIVGYIGDHQAGPVLVQSLEKLEYRGYDSAGVCTNDGQKLIVEKEKGKLKELKKATDDGKKVQGTVGIGHTRWATHGEPSKINAHPHLSSSGSFAVVHNGIIENYMELKHELSANGISFHSSTDTEVIAQLLEYHYNGDLVDTVIKIMPLLKGSYALGIMYREAPDKIIAVRKGSPLIIGIGENENYLASDVPAILDKTRKIYRLAANEIAVIKRDSITVYDMDKNVVEKSAETIEWSMDAAEKDGYEHFMLKEIMEQPKAVYNTIIERIKDGRVVLDEIHLTAEQIKSFEKINIVACGSAYHVGVVAKYIFEKILRKPVEVNVASEFKYSDPIVDEKTLTIVISQSGETADTKEAMYEAQRKGSYTIAVVNVVGSAIAVEANDVIYTLAGPEIAVATTKAYSAQLAVIYMLAIYFGDILGKINQEDYRNYVSELLALPEKIKLI